MHTYTPHPRPPRGSVRKTSRRSAEEIRKVREIRESSTKLQVYAVRKNADSIAFDSTEVGDLPPELALAGERYRPVLLISKIATRGGGGRKGGQNGPSKLWMTKP